VSTSGRFAALNRLAAHADSTKNVPLPYGCWRLFLEENVQCQNCKKLGNPEARRRIRMKPIANIVVALMLGTAAYGAQDVVNAVHGTIDKIDSGTKIVVVKTADGTRRSLHLLDRTAVHGADLSAAASKDSWHGLSEGGEVVAHYTKRGSEDTAVEIDKVGEDGLKAAKGTVREIDRGGRKLVVDTGSGAKETFELTGHASEDAGKDVAKATAKGSKVAVYYTEDAGKKVAHFFESI
jgi:hypothetical protein